MSSFTLTALSPLNEFNHSSNGISVSQCTHYSLVSIATPKGNDKELAQAIHKSFKVRLPKIGQSTFSGTDNAYFLGMQIDQYFVLFEHQTANAIDTISKKTAGSAYLCDQSDSWVILKISGENIRQALERICPLDLHSAVFPVGAVARTIMEHLAVIILRLDEDSFLLLSPRSSAESFLHAVITSIDNTS